MFYKYANFSDINVRKYSFHSNESYTFTNGEVRILTDFLLHGRVLGQSTQL